MYSTSIIEYVNIQIQACPYIGTQCQLQLDQGLLYMDGRLNIKVIIEKFCGEVSLMEQDAIENVS